MELKRRALDRTTPTNAKPGRYRPPDRLLALVGRLEDVHRRIRKAGGESEVIVRDIAAGDAPQAIVDRTLERWDGIDSLVPYAGIILVAPALENLELLDRQCAAALPSRSRPAGRSSWIG